MASGGLTGLLFDWNARISVCGLLQGALLEPQQA